MRRNMFATLMMLSLLAAGFVLIPHNASAQPGEKDMTFFLHWVDDDDGPSKTLPGGGSTWTYFDTTLDFSDENVTLTATGTNNEFQWYLYPALAADVTASSVTLKIWANASGGSNVNSGIALNIYERDATGTETLVKGNNFGSESFTVTPELKEWTITFDSPHTFQEYSSILVLLKANPGTSKYINFYYDSARADSRVVFISSDSMYNDSVITLDYNRNPRTGFDPTSGNKTIFISATINDPFGGYDVKWVNVTLEGPTGNIILDNESMPKVSGTSISYENEYEIAWDYSGYPAGRYNVTVWALDNNGYNYYHHFAQFNYDDYPDTYETSFTIGNAVYVNLLAQDSLGYPLAGATVNALVSGSVVDSGSTNSQGRVNLTLFTGNNVFKVIWQDVGVASQSVTITGDVDEDDPITIITQVYYPKIMVLDSHSEPLVDAAVYLTDPNGQASVTPIKTNNTGHISLSQAPVGDYGVVVRWKGADVADETVHVDSNGIYTINASVYYLTFTALDTEGIALPYIQIVVLDNLTGIVLDFQIANETGVVVSRLPAVSVDVEAYWRDELVCKTNALSIEGDGLHNLACEVYYITVKTVDSGGNALEGVFVIMEDDSGYAIGTNSTNSKGKCVFRLPKGEYIIKAKLRTTYYFTEISQTKTESLSVNRTVEKTVRFDDYPPSFFSTTAFYILLIFLILIIVFTVAYLKKI